MIPAVEVRDEQTTQLLGLCDWRGPIPGPLAEIEFEFATPEVVPNYFCFPESMPPVYWDRVILRWEQFCVGHGRLTYWVLATSRAKFCDLVHAQRMFRRTGLGCHPLEPHPFWARLTLDRHDAKKRSEEA